MLLKREEQLKRDGNIWNIQTKFKSDLTKGEEQMIFLYLKISWKLIFSREQSSYFFLDGLSSKDHDDESEFGVSDFGSQPLDQ